MTEQSSDNLYLYLQNGRFNLKIIRGREDNCLEGIETINSPHFYEVLGRLCKYHKDCLLNFDNSDAIYPKIKVGENYKPRLVEWNLEVADLIPTPEQELLENIVLMHNQVTIAEKRNLVTDESLKSAQ